MSRRTLPAPTAEARAEMLALIAQLRIHGVAEVALQPRDCSALATLMFFAMAQLSPVHVS